MSRYLVVANQTIGGSELMDEIVRRIASGPSSFYVVVPTLPVAGARPDVIAAGDTGITPSVAADLADRQEALRNQAEMVTQSRLSRLTGEIRAKGADADGEVGPPTRSRRSKR